ncbi:MAG TPA: efflux RND transporter periplasmic adaptor subunit [Anaerolineaceae bacterium]|nr:efflux RND transporter periplasmic adaptor subunit [Anaerolineaceae bacterium]HPT23658.1 efflux RND transporter periplasmic adaptor subunit [Anaerolineaceae bacterium]
MTTQPTTKKHGKAGRIILTLVIILALLGAAFLLIRYRRQQAAQKTLASLSTVPYGRENLVSTISGTGTVRPNKDALLLWQTSGTIAASDLAVGDSISEGQLLLSLDTKDLPLDILQAQVEKLNAKTALANLDENTALTRASLTSQIATGQSNLGSLKQQLQILEDRVCVDWRLNNLRDNYDDALQAYRDWPTQVNAAKVQAAKADLDYCDPAVLDEQKAELSSQVALQEQNLSDWQAQLDKIKDGPDPDQKQQLELQLQMAEKRLATQEIQAPFSGTLTALYTNPGDQAKAGAQAIRVSDLTRLFVDVPISEVDIPQVKVGQTADLVFDAYYEQTYTGTVTAVSPVGENRTGVVNYMVTIELEDGLETIKPGMTAGVSIRVEEKQNVFTLPSEAVSTLQGKDVVYVLRDGIPEAVNITIGAYSDNKVEVLKADIQPGELVVLNPPTSILDLMPARFMR